MQVEFKPESHWKQLSIATREELKSRIKAVFDECDHQQQVIIGLYRMVFPDWDRIAKIQGYPTAGEDLWTYICHLFQEFDRIYHPDCMPGGAWMNLGFSVNRDQLSWEIGFDCCTIQYLEQAE